MTDKADYIPIETSDFHQPPYDQDCVLMLTAEAEPDLFIELGVEVIRLIAEAIADEPENELILSRLARHPAASIRAAAASRDCISEAAVHQLMRDSDPDVLRALPRSAAFRRLASADWLISRAMRDGQLAVDVIGELEDYSEIDARKFLAELALSQDPTVRSAIASSSQPGQIVLRRLSQDRDPEVRQYAHAALNR